MASPNRILSLSLGAQAVKLAEFQADKNGGLILTKYQTSELLADPAADATRVSQTALAVQELCGALKAGKSEVNYSISSQSVIIRYVKLPSVGEEKVEQIVTFEAQQNVPFPIDEVVWDYQLVSAAEGAGKGENLEVVLAAIKSDLLEELNHAVEGAGLRTNVVDVAPMALYNAFRYNYSDLDGCSLLIDIGARTTNLIFIEGRRVFSRSIAIGGNTITAAIAKDFKENFTQAEERKKKFGFVSLGGAYAEPEDPELARVSKMVRNTMTRLHADISRSISFYRSQQGGAQPQRVYLCGGAVAMPYMREFFQEKLALPIEFFNPLRNVSVGGGIDATQIGKEAHLLGELVGLGLRTGIDCPMELNLRPTSVARVREMSARKPFLILAGVALLATLGSWYFYYQKSAAITEQVTEELSPKVQALEHLDQEFRKAEQERKLRQQAAAPLLDAVTERDYWLRLLDDVNARLPRRNIWITSLSVGKRKEAGATAAPRPGARPDAAKEAATGEEPALILKGVYLYNTQSHQVAVNFAKALAQSPFFAFDATKESEYVVLQTSQNEGEWTFPFEFRLPLKDPLKGGLAGPVKEPLKP